MSDTPASPTPLSDDDLRETLDLLATAIASISDRVDDQTRVLDRVNKTATEVCSAAFAAQKQTDPEHYGEIIGATIDGRIGDTFTRVGQMAGDLLRASNHTQEVPRKVEDAKSDTMRQLWEWEQKLQNPSSMVRSGCCRFGSCVDGDVYLFLRQQRFHVRCPWSILDHDNHGC